MSESRIVDCRLVLAVRDLRTSTDYYVNVLGFRSIYNDGSWSFVQRDNFIVMLGECPNETPAREIGNHSYVAYLVVEGVDALYEEYRSRTVEMLSAPTTEPWGMREFGVRTIDGHRFKFGERASRS